MKLKQMVDVYVPQNFMISPFTKLKFYLFSKFEKHLDLRYIFVENILKFHSTQTIIKENFSEND